MSDPTNQQCLDCGGTIQSSTHQRTGGYCMPCRMYRDIGLPGQKLKNRDTAIVSAPRAEEATDPADQVPISPRTGRIAEELFRDPDRTRILKRLQLEASRNVPFHGNSTPTELERIRFAILKLIHQHPANEDHAFKLAKEDWRDLYMAAGFGYSATEHERWFEQIIKKSFGNTFPPDAPPG